jgi:P27 family predicted phage terminase small subunit
MKRGRKSLPTEVKRRRGNPGRRKLNEKEPKPGLTLSLPPKWIPRGALPIWKEMVELGVESGVLTDLDKPELATLVMAEYKMRQIASALEKQPLIVMGASGTPMKHPLLNALREYSNLCRLLRNGFGMNPSARSGLKTDKGDDDPDTKREMSAVQPFKPRVINGGQE